MGKSIGYMLILAAVFFGACPSFAAGQLTLTLPQITVEGAGSIEGIVAIDTVTTTNVTVSIRSDNPSEIAHASAEIPAGTNSAAFSLQVIDDALLDGVQTATITAKVQGYNEGSAGVFIQDNDEKTLFLTVPKSVSGVAGSATATASVYLEGVAVSDLHILLQSSDTTAVTVPQTVTIQEGQSNAVFNIMVVENGDADGERSSAITAQFPGFISATALINIGDEEVSRYAVAGLSETMPGEVPYLITVSALNSNDEPMPSYSGSVQLTARSSTQAALSVEPSSVELVDGQWKGSVTIHQSSDNNVQLEVSDNEEHIGLSEPFDLFELRVKKMVTDWALPYIYIQHRDPHPTYSQYDDLMARFIWYNTDFEAVERVVNPGDNALDITVHYGENRLYVSREDEAVVYDRTSKEVLDPLPVTGTINQVNAGRSGRIFTVRGRYSDMWDTETGTKLVSAYAREGGGKCSPNGRFYYHAEDGSSGSKLSKYDISGDTFLKVLSVDTRNFGSEKLVLAGDGSRAFNVGSVFQTSDLEEIAFHGYDKEVYAASFRGEYAVTETELIDSVSGESVLTLPARSDQSVFWPDQSKLLVFNPYTAKLETVSLDSIAGGLSEPGLLPVPTVGSMCMTSLPEVSWTPVPSAIGYDVYMGTDSNAVAMADTNSVEYLGRESGLEHSLPEGMLTGNETYFWRVDIVEFGGRAIKTPLVWNFRTASILIDSAELTFTGIAGSCAEPVSVSVNSAAGDSVNWAVTCTNDWILLDVTNGTATTTLDFALDMSVLTEGDYTAELIFNDGAGSFAVPLTLTAERMSIIQMETDYVLPYVYMLHKPYTSPTAVLMWYNTDTERIEHAVDVGEDARGLAVHYRNDIIYVNSNKELKVFDRGTKQELDSLTFEKRVDRVFPSLHNRLTTVSAVDGNGYSTYYLELYDAETSTNLFSGGLTRSHTGASLDGRFFYNNDISSDKVRKYEVTSNAISLVKTITAGYSQGIVVSMDGSRVCSYSIIYDADLNRVNYVNDQVRAISAFGDLIVTKASAFNGLTGDRISSLPFSTTVMAFSGDQSKLVLFNYGDGLLTAVNTSDMMALPDPRMKPSPSTGSVVPVNYPNLSWSLSPEAFAYDIYLSTDSNTLANADTDSAAYLGRQSERSLPIVESMLSGSTTYYWRVDAVGVEGNVVESGIWNFQTPAIAVEPYEFVFDGFSAAYTQAVSIAVTSVVSDATEWSVSCTNDWVLLGTTNGVGSGTPDISFDMSVLAPGTYTSEIDFHDGNVTLSIPLTLSVESMRIVKMTTDWIMPYIYMVHTSATAPNKSRLIWYNTDTDSIEQILDAGENATDLTVHYADDLIYVNNYQRDETRVFARSSKMELEPLLLDNTMLDNSSVVRINAGGPGRLFVDHGILYNATMQLWDTETESRLDSLQMRDGDAEVSLNGQFYYRSGYTMDYPNTPLVLRKYDVTTDSHVEVGRASVSNSGSNNVLIGMDGRRIYNRGIIYDENLQELLDIGSEVYAASAYGDLVVTSTKAYDGVTGEEIFTLPHSSTVMAFSGDQSGLVLFDSSSSSLSVLETAGIRPLPELNMVPDPAAGSVVGVNLPELAWSAVPAPGYDIYIGTESNAVASATTNSMEYLGRRTTADFPLSDVILAGRQTYYWRVDTVTFDNTIDSGDVWNFKTASITTEPVVLVVEALAAAYTNTVSIDVNSVSGDSVAWTASCASDWVVLGATSGTASAPLDIGFDMSKLAAGSHTTEIIFNDGNGEISLPVTVSAERMQIVTMATDWTQPYIYMLHTLPEAPKKSRLIWYNTDAGAIEKVLGAGVNATDFTVHYADDRIYLNNSEVFDRSSKRLLDSIALGASASLSISASVPNRVTTEGGTYFYLRDTITGSEVAKVRTYYGTGGGECSLDGRSYFRASSGSSGAQLEKYSITSNTVSKVLGQRTKFHYGSRNIFVSMDGSRVYNCGAVFNTEDFNELLSIGSEIYAASAYGDLVITETKAFNGDTGEEFYTLPFPSTVMAFSGDQSELVLFNSSYATITSLATSAIMPIPEPKMIPVPEVGSVQGANLPGLAWSAAAVATAYDVYLGTDSNAVAAAGTNDLQYLGRRTATGFEMSEGMLTGNQTYFWRVDSVMFGSPIVNEEIWNFKTTSIATEPDELNVVGVVADYTQTVSVAVNSTVGNPVAWTASCTNDWVLMASTSGMAPGTMDLSFDMSKLEAGTYTAEIVFDDGNAELLLPVTLSVEDMRIVKMATDWTLPYIYLMHTSSSTPNRSMLIWYNTDTDSIETVLDAGENATDLTVHYPDDRIYVTNWKRVETRVFDRSAKTELDPLLLSSDDVYRINAGRAGHLYTSKEYQIGFIYAFNTTNGAELAFRGIDGSGDFESSPDGNFLYYCEPSLSSSDSLYKFNISQDSIVFEKAVEGGGAGPVMLSLDGTKVFAKRKVYDADLNELLNIGSYIYAVSAYGNLIITETGGYNGVSGEEIYSLPFSSTVMAFSGDQSDLLLFNPTDGTLASLATADIMPIPESDMVPDPSMGSVQGSNLPRLAWSGALTGIGYDVYIGTDSNAVATASTNSVEYLGRRTTSDFPLADGMLAGNQTYYWRVDIAGFGNAVVAGDVWNFRTSSISIEPHEMIMAGLISDYTQTVSVAVNNMVGAGVAWTASCTNEWIILGSAGATAPGTLDVGYDMSGLSAGTYTTEIVFNDGSVDLPVQVTLSVETMRILKMATDWSLPYIYMAHTSTTAPNKSKLIWYNTDTGSIEQVIEAGENATDLTINYADNQIYVNNWRRDETRVFDRITKTEQEPLSLGTDVYKINAAGAGRVITEEMDQWIEVRMYNTQTEEPLATQWEHAGDGDCTVDGRYYYHSDQGTTGSRLSRFSIMNGLFAGEISVSTRYGNGSRNVFVNKDGSRVYNCGYIYDADLNELLNIGSEIYAASANGDLVVTTDKAYDGASGEELYTLPFSTTVMAFSGDRSLLVLFNSSDGTLTVINTADIMPLPVLPMHPAAVSGFDSWQAKYFAAAVPFATAEADGDGDGMSNMEEYIAGTDPTSTDSYFVVHDAVPLPGGQVVLRWDSTTGRVYRVYWTPTLGTDFQPLEPPVHYPQNSYTDQVDRVEQSGFYKVGVEFE
ncbi:hypothetical protein P4C99_16265 [Pontiellaceae bacterium B1224]|nr:hypothetical protein [Pontiellaceae bacterium B1224]